MEASNKKFEEIKEGDSHEFIVNISEEHIKKFAELTQDYNPLHTDESYAAKTRFKKRIAHGMLTSSFFSRLVGMHLPGKRNLYLSQTCNFKKPAYINDEIKIKGTIIRKSESTKMLIIKTEIFNNSNNELLIEGEAKCLMLEGD